MTVTSTNHNPKNDSKYARRRSISKGSYNQLRGAIETLEEAVGKNNVHVYAGPAVNVVRAFEKRWKVKLGAARKIGAVMGYWQSNDPKPSAEMMSVLSPALQADLQLVWDDVNVIVQRRLGTLRGRDMIMEGAGARLTDGARKYLHEMESVIVFAHAPDCFDLIVSKYGFGTQGRDGDHHFFHWQARQKGGAAKGTTHVDDYADH